MNETLHYLYHMPDPSTKQTLCVMPDTEEKPTDWDSFANGTFFIINGQHSVGASQKMLASDLPEAIVKPFSKWKCFIVCRKTKTDSARYQGTTIGVTTLVCSSPLGRQTFLAQDSCGRSSVAQAL
jgi:hypothetical protein